MKEKAIILNLHLKFAEKPWNDTFLLVRRCMEKSRDKSKPCELLVRSLERLQEEFDVSSMNAMRSRLEMIAKQQGMDFHFTEATCYLTADLFYLEVLLLPCGGVKEVKVAPHGQSPVPSESLLQLLRCKHFADFSMTLGGLFAQYRIPGNNKIKLKLLASLKHLGKDLQQISDIPRTPAYWDPHIDMINNGWVGYLKAGKTDCPLTIQFFIPRTETMKTSDSQTTDSEAVAQAAQVTVGSSKVTHRLSTASVFPQPPQLGPQGYPVSAPSSKVPNVMLPACFLLRLQPAIPVMPCFVKKLNQITDVTVPDVDLQWAPLPKLLMGGANSHWETLDAQESIFTVPLPGGEMHSYILPGAAWDVPDQRGVVVDSVAFTHPTHVPALLDVLRHQCAINTLLRSCFSVQCADPGAVCDLHFEVLPESDTSFSVTFHQPNTDSLAVLMVNVSSPHEITCRLFGAGTSDPSINKYISSVMKRCMSIPASMKALCSKLEEITSAPLSPRRPATTEAQNDHSASSSAAATNTNRGSNTFSRGSAVPGDSFSVSASARFALSVARSELLPEINTSPPFNTYPLAPVGYPFTFDEQELI